MIRRSLIASSNMPRSVGEAPLLAQARSRTAVMSNSASGDHSSERIMFCLSRRARW